MKYVYPKFSSKDFFFVRLGGAGLGNLLFTYSRALIWAHENNGMLIWPTWRSIKIGPYIRHEKDKRFYGDLFMNNSEYVDGIKKINLLIFGNKVSEMKKETAQDGDIVIFDKFEMNFKGLRQYRELIRNDLIKNLVKKNQKALEFDFSDSVCIHIRLGDFSKASVEKLKSGCNNTSIPISWYVNVLKKIREITKKNIKAYIFSDGTDEELSEILSLDNVERISFGTSIADILALSDSKLIIASGSSFSMWARFLGNCNSISYINQRKDTVADDKIEAETDGLNFDKTLTEKIRNIYLKENGEQ